MLFRGKSVIDLTENDLLALVGTNRENELVDFKRTAYTPLTDEQVQGRDPKEQARLKNKWKTDLATDLVAFANAGGGWIICGMSESEGIADELIGLGDEFDPDAETRRLGQAADSAVEPPIPGLRFQPVPLTTKPGSHALVIRIPQSFRTPHRVKETRKFHVRRSGRNDEMTIEELRTAFNLSETFAERLRAFRKARVDAIAANSSELSLMLRDGVKVVLHVIPITIVSSATAVDFSPFYSESMAPWVRELSLQVGRFNLDGYIAGDSSVFKPSSASSQYTQIFRDGTIECVYTLSELKDNPSCYVLPMIEHECLQRFETARKIQHHLQIDAPVVTAVSLCNCSNIKFLPKKQEVYFHVDDASPPLRHDILYLPDLVTQGITDATVVLKPIFDVLWNAGGFERSLSYGNDGVWTRSR